MPRRIRRFAILALILVLVGTVALVLTSRPRLEDDRDRVDTRWTPLREPLAQRYTQLRVVLEQLDQAGAGDREVTRQLNRALARWTELSESSGDDVDASAEAKAANTLEGLAVRADRTVRSSARLSTVQSLVDALALFQQTVPTTESVQGYNDAARRYQRTRESVRYAFVARLFGYDARPALALSS